MSGFSFTPSVHYGLGLMKYCCRFPMGLIHPIRSLRLGIDEVLLQVSHGALPSHNRTGTRIVRDAEVPVKIQKMSCPSVRLFMSQYKAFIHLQDMHRSALSTQNRTSEREFSCFSSYEPMSRFSLFQSLVARSDAGTILGRTSHGYQPGRRRRRSSCAPSNTGAGYSKGITRPLCRL